MDIFSRLRSRNLRRSRISWREVLHFCKAPPPPALLGGGNIVVFEQYFRVRFGPVCRTKLTTLSDWLDRSNALVLHTEE